MADDKEPQSKRGNEKLGEKIKARRKALDMSRKALAEEIGVGYRYIAQLESGYRNASHDRLLAIARALGVSLDYLFDSEGLGDDSSNTSAPTRTRGSSEAGHAPQATSSDPSLPKRPTLSEAVTAAAEAIGRLPIAVRLEALNLVQKVVVDSLTSGRIERLAENEVFVFGSNADGIHDGGAALDAYNRFGAVWGQGHGIQGDSYAIDTMSGLSNIAAEVKTFLDYAREHPRLRFRVTPIGTGIAGYRAQQIAPLFAERPSNVVLPPEFRAVLDQDS